MRNNLKNDYYIEYDIIMPQKTKIEIRNCVDKVIS